MKSQDQNYGTLCDYKIGESIRLATQEELETSEAAEAQNQTGAFKADDGRICYVER